MWHPDPDRLTLAALPAEEPDPEVVAHLGECALCRGQVESLRRTVGLARDGGDAADDGQGPPERVWRAITEELAADTRPQRRRRGPVLLVAAAAVLALVVGAVVGYLAGRAGGDPGPGPVVARLAPVGPADANGSGQVSMLADGRMVVTLTGVDEPLDGGYLEVWLLDPATSRLVALGGLTRDGDGYRGTFTVPGDLPLAGYPTVDVSVESWDGDPGHSGRSVLRGEIS